MAQTSPTPVTALPPAPSTTAPSTFSTLADAFIAALAGFVTQVNAIATNVYNNAVDCYNNAVAAATSASAAASSAAAAASTGIKWVSGSFTDGDVRWSPANYQSYRKKGTGAGTTDPSADSANWAQLTVPNPAWVIKAGNYTAVARDYLMVNTTSGAINITLPASPAANDPVYLADYAGKFGTNNCTVVRNGNNIMGLAQDMTISTNNVSIGLIYIDATQGWRVV